MTSLYRSAALGAACVVILAGCGSAASTPLSAARTIHAARTIDVAGSRPLRGRGAGWSTFLHGPLRFRAADVRGPLSAVRWRRQLEAPIVPGPVTLGKIAYVASDGGVLHAIDVGSGADRWSFDGRGAYGSDLSTAPTVLGDGVVLWPGPRHRLFALTPHPAACGLTPCRR